VFLIFEKSLCLRAFKEYGQRYFCRNVLWVLSSQRECDKIPRREDALADDFTSCSRWIAYSKFFEQLLVKSYS
jgi:hypothetical protein